MITETDLLETERLAKAAFSDEEKENHWANPQCVLEMVEEIRQLQKSVEFHREQFRAKALRNGENCLERDSLKIELQRANEEIKRLTKVNESHCRLWNEAEDDLKRTRGLLETAENALRYIVSRGSTGAEFVAREALEKIRESRGES